MTDVAIGSVLGGRLRVDREIGQGGMGIVYEATDEALGRRVAVKVMASYLALVPEHKRRFEREARAVARLSSEHVVRVLEIAETDAGTPYIVMELLDGRSLAAILEEDGLLPVAVAVGYVREALAAVREAHAAGLVHRDLKPANLFLARRLGRPPIVKVLDFGVVKDVGGVTANLTKTGDAMGTPAYMAPEQVRAGDPVDARTDVWAIGVTLYELLTRELPFDARSVAGILQAILEGRAVPVRARRADVSEALEAILARCLAKSPADRFADAAALDDALAALALAPPLPAPRASTEPLARPASTATAPMASEATAAASTSTAPLGPNARGAPDAFAPTIAVEATERRRRVVKAPPPRRASSGALFAVAFLFVVVVGTLAGVIYLLSRPPPPPAAADDARATTAAPPAPRADDADDASSDASSGEARDAEVDDAAASGPDAEVAGARRAPRPTGAAAQPRRTGASVTLEHGQFDGLKKQEVEAWLARNRADWIACASGRSCVYAMTLVLRADASTTQIVGSSAGRGGTCDVDGHVNDCIMRVAERARPYVYCGGTANCAARVQVTVHPGEPAPPVTSPSRRAP